MEITDLGISISIVQVIEEEMKNEEFAHVFTIKIENKNDQPAPIELSEIFLVSQDGGQLESDHWLAGGFIRKGAIKKNAYQYSKFVFYKNNVDSLSQGDLLYMNVKNDALGIALELSFILQSEVWMFLNAESIGGDTINFSDVLREKLFNSIQRLEALEEKCGIYFDNLSIGNIRDDSFDLFIEVYSSNGNQIEKNVKIKTIIYGKNGKIITTKSAQLWEDEFFIFKILDVFVSTYDGFDLSSITKIMIVPET